jgi:hypothetical protein
LLTPILEIQVATEQKRQRKRDSVSVSGRRARVPRFGEECKGMYTRMSNRGSVKFQKIFLIFLGSDELFSIIGRDVCTPPYTSSHFRGSCQSQRAGVMLLTIFIALKSVYGTEFDSRRVGS